MPPRRSSLPRKVPHEMKLYTQQRETLLPIAGASLIFGPTPRHFHISRTCVRHCVEFKIFLNFSAGLCFTFYAGRTRENALDLDPNEGGYWIVHSDSHALVVRPSSSRTTDICVEYTVKYTLHDVSTVFAARNLYYLVMGAR